MGTLDSGIGYSLEGYAYQFLDFFPGATFLIREGNAYFFSKYPLFDGIGEAYFNAGLCLIFLPNVPGATLI